MGNQPLVGGNKNLLEGGGGGGGGATRGDFPGGGNE